MDDKKSTILIVDDEQVLCELLYGELEEQGYECTLAFDGNDALTKLASQSFDAVLLDIKLPGISGVEVLRSMRSHCIDTAIVMITAVNEIDTAVEAMRLGASDYIVKPFALDRVNTALRVALQSKIRLPQRTQREVIFIKDKENGESVEEKVVDRMGAIARGVEARYEIAFGYSKIVTKETINIARRLGVPKKEIKRWADARARLEFERDRVMKCSLKKLEQSPLAQSILGVAVPHLYLPNSKEHQN